MALKNECRCEELELRIADLEEKVARLCENADLGYHLSPPPLRFHKARGPKRKIEKYELLNRRDLMADFVMRHWPEFAEAIRRAKTPDSLRTFFEPYLTRDDSHQCAKRVVENAEAVFEFTKRSGRFFGNPFHFANATCGLPELHWRSAFNECGKEPQRIGLHQRCYRDHLKRRFALMFKQLLKAKTEQKVLEIVNSSRSKDEVLLFLRARPDLWFGIEKQGRSNPVIL